VALTILAQELAQEHWGILNQPLLVPPAFHLLLSPWRTV
jgi:hypothetical protein